MRRRVQCVAIEVSTEFHQTARPHLPKAKFIADHFHMSQRVNLIVRQVRQRSSHEVRKHRGKAKDSTQEIRSRSHSTRNSSLSSRKGGRSWWRNPFLASRASMRPRNRGAAPGRIGYMRLSVSLPCA
ncbi:transposase [Glutamicibacter sp. JL.03c]|uniref:transposase n=1 Tax=Glutamicibacter sp. JL.03c TaxID=2984842 RepID=UPI0039AF8A33